MILFPAIDLQNGKAVRLKQGARNKETVFADNPVIVGEKFRDAGASWLHIVDLDGAFDGQSANLQIIGKLAKLGLKTQVGGGIRAMDHAQKLLDLGISRLIIGTIALEDPSLLEALCARFPNKIGVSLDAQDGKLKTRGWLGQTNQTAISILRRLENSGVEFIVYTDIERDGMRTGPNIKALEEILSATRLPVIAAGGVATLEDLKKLSGLPGNLQGAISGRAIYEGSLKLDEAMKWLAHA